MDDNQHNNTKMYPQIGKNHYLKILLRSKIKSKYNWNPDTSQLEAFNSSFNDQVRYCEWRGCGGRGRVPHVQHSRTRCIKLEVINKGSINWHGLRSYTRASPAIRIYDWTLSEGEKFKFKLSIYWSFRKNEGVKGIKLSDWICLKNVKTNGNIIITFQILVRKLTESWRYLTRSAYLTSGMNFWRSASCKGRIADFAISFKPYDKFGTANFHSPLRNRKE